MQKSRITNLSTRYLTYYKNAMWCLLATMIGYLVFQVLTKGQLHVLFFIPFIATLIFRNRNVFHVEFDYEFLYLIRKDQDTLIPLQNIKDVTLKTMGGLYEIELYHPESVGDKLYYKPSLLYPFNFKLKDRIADILRDNIEKAKRKPVEFQKNALMS